MPDGTKISLTTKGFFDYLKKESDAWKLSDSMPFTKRRHNVDNSCKSRWKQIKSEICENETDDSEIKKEVEKISNVMENDSNGSLLYTDKSLDLMFISSSLVDKLGYVTYYKDYMTWYDLSYNLPEILAVFCGTKPEVVRIFFDQFIQQSSDIRFPKMSTDEFSKIVIGNKYIPVELGYSMLDSICPAVDNFFKTLLCIGDETNYKIRGKETLVNSKYSEIIGRDSNVSVLRPYSHELVDTYIVSVLRLAVYYILGQIHDLVYKLELVGTNDSNNKKDAMVAWTHTDLVFQNSSCKVYPDIEIVGRNGVSFTIHPHTYNCKDAVLAHLRGDINLL